MTGEVYVPSPLIFFYFEFSHFKLKGVLDDFEYPISSVYFTYQLYFYLQELHKLNKCHERARERQRSLFDWSTELNSCPFYLELQLKNWKDKKVNQLPNTESREGGKQEGRGK